MRIVTLTFFVAVCSCNSSSPAIQACGAPGANWQRCSSNPSVLGWRQLPGTSRYQWTMADPSVLYDEEEHLWKAWWSSVVAESCADVINASLRSRSIDIFYAESSDGLTWTFQDDPALASRQGTDTWDDTTVETPTILKLSDASVDRRYVLIYGGGNDTQLKVLGQTGWQLGIAFSTDGKHFTRLPAAESPYAGQSTPFTTIDGLLLLARDLFPGFPGTAAVTSGLVADPELVRVGDTYHLWFAAAGVDSGGSLVGNAAGTRTAFGIGHATSTDLIHWTATDGENPAIMSAGQPTVVRDEADGRFHMWYSLDTDQERQTVPSALYATLGFFHALSIDGSSWIASSTREFTWNKNVDYESLGLMNGPEVVKSGDEYRLYYSAWGATDVPSGSCAYLNQSGGGITTTPGVFGLNLATRLAQ